MGRPRPIAVAFAIALVATSGLAVTVDATLVVRDAETGERLLSVPVTEETPIALAYTHSVEKSRVYEAYAVRGDHLELTRIEFESYGWGFPAGANVTRENGTFVAEMNRTATELTVKPGEVAGHRLHVGDRTYDLVALSDARSVTLEVEPSGADRPAPAFPPQEGAS